jgi:helix-turn-helix protein
VTGTRQDGSPTVLRMILARQLQALREKAGMSYEQAATAIYSSEWTIRRMERAEGGLKPLTVKSLLMAYGITDPGEIDAFLSLSRDEAPGDHRRELGLLLGTVLMRAVVAGRRPEDIPSRSLDSLQRDKALGTRTQALAPVQHLPAGRPDDF